MAEDQKIPLDTVIERMRERGPSQRVSEEVQKAAYEKDLCREYSPKTQWFNR